MRTALCLILLAPNLFALDLTTLDGKTYHDCQVGQVFPDSICLLFSGGGARVKFMNLPESIRTEFGYDAEKATAFEKAEAERQQRERALLAAQRQQLLAQKLSSVAVSNQPTASQTSPSVGNARGSYAAVNTASAANGSGNAAANQFGGGSRRTGAQYAGVRIGATPGGIYGINFGPTYRSRGQVLQDLGPSTGGR